MLQYPAFKTMFWISFYEQPIPVESWLYYPYGVYGIYFVF